MPASLATAAPVRTSLEEEGAWLRLVLDAPKGNILDPPVTLARSADRRAPSLIDSSTMAATAVVA